MGETRFETVIDRGIERVICHPAAAFHQTPILFIHGMWHAAWCWRAWQERFALWGWESCAISLPGHGGSPRQKSVRFSTMSDYLQVLAREVDQCPTRPILFGHSMGGALAQWYLKRVADDLPATVLLASWTSHSTFGDGTSLHLKRDPLGFLLMGLTMSAQPLVRSPKWVASLLLGEHATITAEELHARLGEESYLVLSQHNPPLWRPRPNVSTPMLWVAAGKDAVISAGGARASASFYGADFVSVPDAGHDLMFDASEGETCERIASWLSSKGL